MVQDIGDLEEAEARDNGLVRWLYLVGSKKEVRSRKPTQVRFDPQ
jgi:hypothetical protein